MWRPPGPHVKDMLKFSVSRSHDNMGRYPDVAPKVNIGEYTNITFKVTPGDLRIAQPMKIQKNNFTRSFTSRKTTSL